MQTPLFVRILLFFLLQCYFTLYCQVLTILCIIILYCTLCKIFCDNNVICSLVFLNQWFSKLMCINDVIFYWTLWFHVFKCLDTQWAVNLVINKLNTWKTKFSQLFQLVRFTVNIPIVFDNIIHIYNNGNNSKMYLKNLNFNTTFCIAIY